MTERNTPSWFAADWGTTHLRVWAMDNHGKIVAHRQSGKGMGCLARSEFEPALLELIEDLLTDSGPLRVVICGMAGSRQGWQEAPYLATPCAPPGLETATRVESADSRISVFILPGVKQLDPPDVMRGEETQIAGFLASEPDFTGTLCLPGTHTKWVPIRNGSIESFQTFMTGELFSLLSKQSVLRHGLSKSDWDESEFVPAVVKTATDSASLAAHLFGIRAGGLVAGLAPGAARARLSGYLIGAEIAAAKPVAGSRGIIILGSDQIAGTYSRALDALGIPARMANADDCTLRGLTLACQSIQETAQ